MTFILLTCVPTLAAVLLVHREPREPRHRPACLPWTTPRGTLISCCLALPRPGTTA